MDSALVLVLIAVLVVILILVLVVILVLSTVLIVVLVAVLVLGTILVVVLIVHNRSSECLMMRISAYIACPIFQDLSFGLKIRLTRRPAKMAVAIPPAQAFSPPVKIPRNPSFVIASLTPLARL